MSTLYPNGRDMATDPRVGDVAKPSTWDMDREVVGVGESFGDETLIWVQERYPITLRQWKRWVKRTAARPKL